MFTQLRHGFHESEDPDNEYINSTTFLDGSDNIFNEDFHVAHHLVHTMHWIDLKVIERKKMKILFH